MDVLLPRPPTPSATRSPVDGTWGVAVVAPLGRDARLTADCLRGGRLPATACINLDALCDGLSAGRFGAALITSESLADAAATHRLRVWLQGQPAWSDVPVIVLTTHRHSPIDTRRVLGHLGARPSATVLERPVPASALVTAARLALLSRQRQLEVRALLAELEHAKATLEARVVARTREVRRLASDLALAEHAERRRIAHLLHDDLQQRLHGLSVTLSLLGRSADDPDRANRLLVQAQETLREATSLTRSLSHELAPPMLQGEGLSELIEWMAAHAHERYGLTVESDIEDTISLPREDVRVLLSQVMGELLFNVSKHAGVDRVRVTARDVPGTMMVRVVVADDGRGFDPSALGSGMGVASVCERAELIGGHVHIDSAPGQGTRVTVEVPAKAEPPS